MLQCPSCPCNRSRQELASYTHFTAVLSRHGFCPQICSCVCCQVHWDQSRTLMVFDAAKSSSEQQQNHCLPQSGAVISQLYINAWIVCTLSQHKQQLCTAFVMHELTYIYIAKTGTSANHAVCCAYPITLQSRWCISAVILLSPTSAIPVNLLTVGLFCLSATSFLPPPGARLPLTA